MSRDSRPNVADRDRCAQMAQAAILNLMICGLVVGNFVCATICVCEQPTRKAADAVAPALPLKSEATAGINLVNSSGLGATRINSELQVDTRG
jgi:hypothetical protein